MGVCWVGGGGWVFLLSLQSCVADEVIHTCCMIETVIYGIIIGVIISAPLGPVGIMCLRETLYSGRKEGLLVGVGAMVSDVFYCFLAYLGVEYILGLVLDHDTLLRLIGDVFLLIFGAFVFIQAKRKGIKDSAPKRLSKVRGLGIVVRALGVTLCNPLILLLILPLYARFQFVQPTIYPSLTLWVALMSIAIGCMLWWTALTSLVSILSARLGMRGVRYINYSVALVLWGLGVFGIISSLAVLSNHPFL